MNCRNRTQGAQSEGWRSNFNRKKSERHSRFTTGPSFFVFLAQQSVRVFARREDFWERAAFPSPREERVGRDSTAREQPRFVPLNRKKPSWIASASWSAPVLWRFRPPTTSTAPEDWRTPRPCGGTNGSWVWVLQKAFLLSPALSSIRWRRGSSSRCGFAAPCSLRSLAANFGLRAEKRKIR